MFNAPDIDRKKSIAAFEETNQETCETIKLNFNLPSYPHSNKTVSRGTVDSYPPN